MESENNGSYEMQYVPDPDCVITQVQHQQLPGNETCQVVAGAVHEPPKSIDHPCQIVGTPVASGSEVAIVAQGIHQPVETPDVVITEKVEERDYVRSYPCINQPLGGGQAMIVPEKKYRAQPKTVVQLKAEENAEEKESGKTKKEAVSGSTTKEEGRKTKKEKGPGKAKGKQIKKEA